MTSPKILIDGVDNVGKTTLCEALSRRLDLPVIKMADCHDFLQGLRIDIEEASFVFNTTITQFKKFGFIMDRGYTSSWVYNRVFQRRVDLSYIEGIEKALNPQVFILINTDIETLKTRVDEVIDVSYYEAIQNVYIELARERGYILYDTAGKSLGDVYTDVLNAIQSKLY